MENTQKQITKTRGKGGRIYPLDETYFETIDNEEKAYFLGFLYADGCNSVKKGTVRLCLQERDKEILLKLSTLLQPTKPLQYCIKTSGYKSHQNSYSLNISSRCISEQLVELGCVGAKTMILTFPTEAQVHKHLQRHFIRGYFDGDGYVGKHDASLVGTFNFCTSLSLLTEEALGIKFYLRFKGNYPTSEICLSRRKAKLFLDWLYTDSTIYLQRKFDKYLLQVQYAHDIKKRRECCVEDCSSIQLCKNYCSYHYDQVRKNNMSYKLKNEVKWL